MGTRSTARIRSRAILPPYAGLGAVRRRGRRRGRPLHLHAPEEDPASDPASTSSLPARSSRRASRAGATSSTRSCTAHPRTCRGASPSTAPIASRRGSVRRSTREATTGFHPLFFYESALDILGGFVALFISRRYLDRLQPGDLRCVLGHLVRADPLLLETFRWDWDWKLVASRRP